MIHWEETAGAIEIIDGQVRRHSKGKMDHLLRVIVNRRTQAVALVETKKINWALLKFFKLAFR